MTIYIRIKSLSKRKPIVDRIPIGVMGEITTADSLIEYIVRQNVVGHNDQPTDVKIMTCLTDEDIESGEITGKIGFGEKKDENNQNPDKAVKDALQSFSDGIFRLYVNDIEYGMGDKLTIKDGDEVTFIRLTMLAGRLW